jgi:hypothetical protein
MSETKSRHAVKSMAADCEMRSISTHAAPEPVTGCRRPSAYDKTAASIAIRAKHSFDRSYWQTAAGLCISCAALSAMALPAAPPAFQCVASSGAQFHALDSGFRHRPSRHATNPDRRGNVGTGSAYWIVKLGRSARMGRVDRYISAHGLRLLVVALGQSHGAALLAIS